MPSVVCDTYKFCLAVTSWPLVQGSIRIVFIAHPCYTSHTSAAQVISRDLLLFFFFCNCEPWYLGSLLNIQMCI